MHESYPSPTSSPALTISSLLKRWTLPRHWMLICFAPLTAIVLWSDSLWLREIGMPSQWLSNLLAPLFLLALLPHLTAEQRRSTLIFVPFSAIGEAIFSLLFGLYSYADGGIPLYVPFGHAILFAVGMIISDHPAVISRTKLIRWALLAFHLALIGGAWLALGDSLSAVFGLLFGLVMWRKRGKIFYLIMGVLVLYIELLGTAFGCWYWWPNPWGLLHTLNPPVGAFACYLVADLIVIRLGRLYSRISTKLAPARS
jgi:hypothetical protein